jgi:hypothetical protein
MSKRLKTKPPVKPADDRADRLDQLRRSIVAAAVCRGHDQASRRLAEQTRAAWKRDGAARLPLADVEAVLEEFGLMEDYRARLAGPELNGPRAVK